MTKKVTLEDLARMTGGGFHRIGQNFEDLNQKVDKGFTENHKDHQEFKKNFAEINFKLTETVQRSEFLELEQRLRKVETKLGLSA